MPTFCRKRAARLSDMPPFKAYHATSTTPLLTERNPPQQTANTHPSRQSGNKPASKYLHFSNDGEDEDEDEGKSTAVDWRDEDSCADGEEEGGTGVGYEKRYDYGDKEDGEGGGEGDMGDMGDAEDVGEGYDVDEEVVGGKDGRERIPGDISFSGVFNRKANMADIDGLWGWDATAGSYGNTPFADPSKGPQKQIMDKTILGAVMSLADAAAGEAGEADAGSSGDTTTVAADQFDDEAAMEGTGNESSTAIESMPEGSEDSQHSQDTHSSNMGARLQRNERRIRRAQRKMVKYETEIRYLEHKRRRLIWML